MAYLHDVSAGKAETVALCSERMEVTMWWLLLLVPGAVVIVWTIAAFVGAGRCDRVMRRQWIDLEAQWEGVVDDQSDGDLPETWILTEHDDPDGPLYDKDRIAKLRRMGYEPTAHFGDSN